MVPENEIYYTDFEIPLETGKGHVLGVHLRAALNIFDGEMSEDTVRWVESNEIAAVLLVQCCGNYCSDNIRLSQEQRLQLCAQCRGLFSLFF